MRKLLWFTVGFGFSCGFCAWFATGSLSFPLLVAVLATILVGRGGYRIGEIIGFGACIGLIWFGCFRQVYLQPALDTDGKEMDCAISVTDYSWKSDYGTVGDGTLELDGKTYAVRFYLNEVVHLTPGDSIQGTFRLRYTAGAEESATFHAGRGIFLLGYQRGELSIQRGECGRFSCIGARLSRWLAVRLEILFPNDVFPFIKALLLGDSADLSYEVNTHLKLSGIRHIIAVSGLHVMLLYGLVHRLTFQNKWLTALICLPLLAVFSAVAGFTASVTRASLMAALMMLASLWNREYDPPSAMSFSALIMLMVNPMVITAVSFQLTVGCVAGMQLFSGPIREWLKWRWKEGKSGPVNRLKRWLSSSISVTLGAMCLTTPMNAAYFGNVSLIGIVSNLVLLWVVNLVFNGLVITVVISLFSIRAAGMVSLLLAWPIRLLLRCAKILGSMKFACVYTNSPYVVAWLVFLYILLLIFLSSFKKRAAQFILCGAAGLCLALLFSYTEPRMDECRVTVLDVGQGQSILLQSKGSTFLVDCGGSSDTDTADLVAQTLMSQGIYSLDGVILTHWDRDHAGAFPYLQTRMDTGTLYAPHPDSRDDIGIWVTGKQEIPCGAGIITLFSGDFPEDDQENGLCVLFESENCAILITGDRSGLGERMLMEMYALPRVDLLIAGHHGSQYSTSERLLETVQPDTVFISAGKDNRYGHPSQALLQRLETYGCRVYRTDLQGTLRFRR